MFPLIGSLHPLYSGAHMFMTKMLVRNNIFDFFDLKNHFIPYLATRHRIVTKVTAYFFHSIIVGGIAP